MSGKEDKIRKLIIIVSLGENLWYLFRAGGPVTTYMNLWTNALVAFYGVEYLIYTEHMVTATTEAVPHVA